MTLERKLGMVAAVAAVVAVAGCGDDDKSADKTSQKPATTTGKTAPGLKRAVLPTCSVSGFAKPQVQEISQGGREPQAWSLTFTRRADPAKPPAPSVTTSVVVVETPLAAAPNKLPGFERVTIAGRSVRIRRPGSGTGKNKARTFAATWATKRARFTMLANGTSDRTLKQFIACFP